MSNHAKSTSIFSPVLSGNVINENEAQIAITEFSFQNLIDKLNEAMYEIEKKKNKSVTGIIDLNEFESSIPMIPLNKDTLKYSQNEINELKSMSPTTFNF